MDEQPDPPVLSVEIDPRALDIFEFADAARQATGVLHVSQLPRMLNEVPADAPEGDSSFQWCAYGSTRPVLAHDGAERAQPYLRLVVAGSVWLECQRCLTPYKQTFDLDVVYLVAKTHSQAEAFPLDNDEFDVIVGSHRFDLIDLIEEELLLSLPLVPKHDVCMHTHASFIMSSPSEGNEAKSDKSSPFASLAVLKGSDQRH